MVPHSALPLQTLGGQGSQSQAPLALMMVVPYLALSRL